MSLAPWIRPAEPARRLVAVLLAVLMLAPSLRATVDDAYSFALEAAEKPAKDGLVIRQDYWRGQCKSGQRQVLHVFMLKGNDYWYWLGTTAENPRCEIHVLGADGKPVEVENTRQPRGASVRVRPDRTGALTLVFTIKATAGGEEPFDWAVACGYRWARKGPEKPAAERPAK